MYSCQILAHFQELFVQKLKTFLTFFESSDATCFYKNLFS